MSDIKRIVRVKSLAPNALGNTIATFEVLGQPTLLMFQLGNGDEARLLGAHMFKRCRITIEPVSDEEMGE